MCIQAWGEKVKSTLDFEGGKKILDLRTRRVDVDPNAYHLIVGLGGTGCRALIETKGRIQLTCKDSGNHVAYLAFDTCQKDLDSYTSSDETGQVRFDVNEKQFLDPNGIAGALAPAQKAALYSSRPEIFEWLDDRVQVPGDGKGANHTRQAGRLLYWNKRDEIKRALHDAIAAVNARMGGAAAFTVYLLAGISGGTGSGTFLDMGYLIREEMESFAGNIAAGAIYGYLFMPDINNSYRTTTPNDREENFRNAYAALQELDYNLGLYDVGESFNIHLPNNGIYRTGLAPDKLLFTQTHLVGATDHNGALMINADKKANQVIAQSILSFVANQSVEDTQGQQIIGGFYGNLPSMANAAVVTSNEAYRFNKYIAIGSSQYELPIDDIMMYVTRLLFGKIDILMQNRPDAKNKDVRTIKNSLLFSADDSYTAAVHQVNELMISATLLTYETLRTAVPDDSYYYINQGRFAYENIAKWSEKVQSNLTEAEQGFKARFDREMETVFLDPDRGPAYAYHLIIDPEGILSAVRAQHRIAVRFKGEKPFLYPVGPEDSNVKKTALNDLMLLRRGGSLFKTATQKNSERDQCNSSGLTFFAACVYAAVTDQLDEYYKRIEAYIEKQRDDLFRFLNDLLIELGKTFVKNSDVLLMPTDAEKALAAQIGPMSFSWEPLTVWRIHKYIEELFDGTIQTHENGQTGLFDKFVKDLWEATHVWIMDPTRFDPKRFVSGYIDSEFKKIAEESIETVVTRLLQDAGGNAAVPLAKSVQDSLAPKLLSAAEPLYFNGHNVPVGSKFTIISVPESCSGIFNAMKAYCVDNKIPATLQKSKMRNRIYVQTVLSGIQLAGNEVVWQAEKVYAIQHINIPGIHLYHPEGNSRSINRIDWNELYTLIPRSYRPTDGIDPNTMRLLEREDRQKGAFAALFDAENDYRAASPIISISQDETWTVSFHMVKEDVRYEAGRLIFTYTAYGQRAREIESFAWKDQSVSEIRRAIGAVRKKISDGLSAQPGYHAYEFKPLSTKSILNTDGTTWTEQTFKNLLEFYLRRYMLIRAITAEKAKYAAMEQFVKDAEAELKQKEATDLRLTQMINMMMTGYLYTETNVLNNHVMIRFCNRNPERPQTKDIGDLGMIDEAYQEYWRLYRMFVELIGSDKPVAGALNKYRQKAEDAISTAQDKGDTAVMSGWSDTAGRIGEAVRAILDDLNFATNPTDDEKAALSFYQKMKDRVDSLRKAFDALIAKSGSAKTTASSSTINDDFDAF